MKKSIFSQSYTLLIGLSLLMSCLLVPSGSQAHSGSSRFSPSLYFSFPGFSVSMVRGHTNIYVPTSFYSSYSYRPSIPLGLFSPPQTNQRQLAYLINMGEAKRRAWIRAETEQYRVMRSEKQQEELVAPEIKVRKRETSKQRH